MSRSNQILVQHIYCWSTHLIIHIKQLGLSDLQWEFSGPHVVFNLSPERFGSIPRLVWFIEPHKSHYWVIVNIISCSHKCKVAYTKLIIVYLASATMKKDKNPAKKFVKSLLVECHLCINQSRNVGVNFFSNPFHFTCCLISHSESEIQIRVKGIKVKKSIYKIISTNTTDS